MKWSAEVSFVFEDAWPFRWATPVVSSSAQAVANVHRPHFAWINGGPWVAIRGLPKMIKHELAVNAPKVFFLEEAGSEASVLTALIRH